MKHLLLSLAAASALALVGCNADHPGAPTPVGVRAIRSATSFGFCAGYCRSALEITSERATYRLFDDRTQQPELVRSAAISAAEWQELETAVRRQPLEALPAVIGCPDCADGGAESLEVVAQDWSHSVTFDRGVAIQELQPLLDRVRAIRDRLDSELRPR